MATFKRKFVTKTFQKSPNLSHCFRLKGYLLEALPVQPDLAKFHHFGKIIQSNQNEWGRFLDILKSNQGFFKKWVIPGLFFHIFHLFYKHLTVIKCSIKVADDWIQTRVLWYHRQPLCQLHHNHCPNHNSNQRIRMVIILYE